MDGSSTEELEASPTIISPEGEKYECALRLHSQPLVTKYNMRQLKND